MKRTFLNATSKVVGFVVVGTMVLASCGDGSAENASETITSEADLPFVNPENVLLAGLILAVGDVDRALAEGLVNPMEVEAAVDAIEQETMNDWLNKADTSID